MKKIFILSLASLALAACSTPDDNHPNLGIKDDGFAKATCFYSQADGDMAIDSMAQKRSIVKAAFGKEYNQSKLLGIGSASEEETLRYIRMTGPIVYKIASNGVGCSLHQEATPVPPRVLEFWKRSEEAATKDNENKKKEDVQLLGLYVGLTTATLDEVGETKPLIIVRENTTRWTLVHEFMHHLFMERALEQGHSDAVMKNRLVEAFAAVKKIDNSELKSVSGLKRSVRTVVRFIKMNDEVLVHYALEEMTIEDQLRKAYEKGVLKFVTPYDYNSGGWYIKYSANNFSKIKMGIEQMISTLRLSIYDVEMTDEERAEHFTDLDSAHDILSKREDHEQNISPIWIPLMIFCLREKSKFES